MSPALPLPLPSTLFAAPPKILHCSGRLHPVIQYPGAPKSWPCLVPVFLPHLSSFALQPCCCRSSGCRGLQRGARPPRLAELKGLGLRAVRGGQCCGDAFGHPSAALEPSCHLQSPSLCQCFRLRRGHGTFAYQLSDAGCSRPQFSHLQNGCRCDKSLFKKYQEMRFSADRPEAPSEMKLVVFPQTQSLKVPEQGSHVG